MGELISFDRIHKGYLAGTKGPGVVLLQEWWGLVGHICNIADQLAAEGFLVLAPDFYGGTSTDDPTEAESLFMELNIENAAKTMGSAISFLQNKSKIDKVGTVGFCMGGQLSLYAAAVNASVGACVNFYGVHPNVHPPISNIKCPVLGLFGKDDPMASPAVVAKLESDLSAAGVPHEFHSFEAGHAFFNDQRPAFNQDAADECWKLLIPFLRKNLI